MGLENISIFLGSETIFDLLLGFSHINGPYFSNLTANCNQIAFVVVIENIDI